MTYTQQTLATIYARKPLPGHRAFTLPPLTDRREPVGRNTRAREGGL